MKRIVAHWTGGTYEPNAVDLASYHGLTNGKGEFVPGNKPPEANKAPLGPDYVRHTGGGNSDAIGHALCGMGGGDVKERPLVLGSYPIKREQWAAAAVHVADYCEIYNIPPVPGRVETHAEFYQRTKRGRYKWDITAIEGYSQVAPPEKLGNDFRRMVQAELSKRQGQHGHQEIKPPSKWGSLIAAILDMFRG